MHAAYSVADVVGQVLKLYPTVPRHAVVTTAALCESVADCIQVLQDNGLIPDTADVILDEQESADPEPQVEIVKPKKKRRLRPIQQDTEDEEEEEEEEEEVIDITSPKKPSKRSASRLIDVEPSLERSSSSGWLSKSAAVKPKARPSKRRKPEPESEDSDSDIEGVAASGKGERVALDFFNTASAQV